MHNLRSGSLVVGSRLRKLIRLWHPRFDEAMVIVEHQTQKMRLAAGPLSHGVVVKELYERPLVGKVMRVPWRAVVDGLGAR